MQIMNGSSEEIDQDMLIQVPIQILTYLFLPLFLNDFKYNKFVTFIIDIGKV